MPSQQLRGHLSAAAFDRKIVPRAGLDEACVLPKDVREKLATVVAFEKAKSVLLGEWGFGELVEWARSESSAFFLFGEPPMTRGSSLNSSSRPIYFHPFFFFSSAEVLSSR